MEQVIWDNFATVNPSTAPNLTCIQSLDRTASVLPSYNATFERLDEGRTMHIIGPVTFPSVPVINRTTRTPSEQARLRCFRFRHASHRISFHGMHLLPSRVRAGMRLPESTQVGLLGMLPVTFRLDRQEATCGNIPCCSRRSYAACRLLTRDSLSSV